MKVDARVLIAPLIAIVLLVLTVRQTSEALKSSGAWRRPTLSAVRPVDPYARIDFILGQEQHAVDPARMRDPFSYGQAAVTNTPRPRPVQPRPTPPVEPPKPVLTSITWSGDQDPRATIRYNGRDYSVGVGSLFSDFRVVSIQQTHVVLEHNGERTALTLRSKGD